MTNVVLSFQKSIMNAFEKEFIHMFFNTIFIKFYYNMDNLNFDTFIVEYGITLKVHL